MKLRYFGRTTAGKLTIVSGEKLREDILENFPDTDIEITVVKRKKKRSNRQNSYWHGVVIPFAKERFEEAGMNCTHDKAHELLKAKFLMMEDVDIRTGEVLQYVGSTTALSTSEFSRLCEDVKQWFAEFFNAYLPDPGENLFFE